jgi:hypothetical protein
MADNEISSGVAQKIYFKEFHDDNFWSKSSAPFVVCCFSFFITGFSFSRTKHQGENTRLSGFVDPD